MVICKISQYMEKKYLSSDFEISQISKLNCMQFWQARNETLQPNVVRQLAKELKALDETPPEGIKVIVNDEDLTVIFAEIDGPGLHRYLIVFKV